MEFKIGYEPMGGSVSEIGLQEILKEAIKDKVELPYWKVFAKMGDYRRWIHAMTDESLEGFIKANEAKLQGLLHVKHFAPSFGRFEEILNRIALYQVELHLRHYEDMDQLDSDLNDYRTLWTTRYRTMVEKLEADKAALEAEEKDALKQPNHPVSGTNPYY